MLEILLIDRLIDEDVMAIAWESSIGTIWLPNMTEIHQEMDVILNVHKYGFQHAVWTNPKEGSVFSYVAPITNDYQWLPMINYKRDRTAHLYETQSK